TGASTVRRDDAPPRTRKPAGRSGTFLRASVHRAWAAGSAVVVQLELMRVRAQPQLVELGGPLVVQPGLDQVVGEPPALGEEGVVALQGVQHGLEGARDLGDGVGLVRRKLV